jgi:hypothetical protein
MNVNVDYYAFGSEVIGGGGSSKNGYRCPHCG